MAAPVHAWEVAPAQLPGLVSSLRREVESSVSSATPADLSTLVPAPELRVGGEVHQLEWLYQAVRSPDRTVRTIAWERLQGWEATLRERPATFAPARVAATARAVLSAEDYRPLPRTSWIDPWLPHLERLLDLLLAPLRRRGPAAGRGEQLRGLLLYAA
ncbi:MAG: hypothetical protein HUU35_03675, partial [Armatimonadetes bacterium]|nr:hypothetical protein [Armatimonadota bacterium]